MMTNPRKSNSSYFLWQEYSFYPLTWINALKNSPKFPQLPRPPSYLAKAPTTTCLQISAPSAKKFGPSLLPQYTPVPSNLVHKFLVGGGSPLNKVETPDQGGGAELTDYFSFTLCDPRYHMGGPPPGLNPLVVSTLGISRFPGSNTRAQCSH